MTGDPGALRDLVNEQYGRAADVPHYRAMLDREGITSLGDSAILGDEAEVTRGIGALFDAGATELVAFPFGSADERKRTSALLAELNG